MATEIISFRLIKGAFCARQPLGLSGVVTPIVWPLLVPLCSPTSACFSHLCVLAGHVELRLVLSLCPRRDKVGLPHVLAGLQWQLLSAGTCGTAFRPRSSHELLRYLNPSAKSLWNKKGHWSTFHSTLWLLQHRASTFILGLKTWSNNLNHFVPKKKQLLESCYLQNRTAVVFFKVHTSRQGAFVFSLLYAETPGRF